jgi:hypothetical protein
MPDVEQSGPALSRHRATDRSGERCISVSFMFVERLDKEQLLVLRKVFPRACIELGIGAEEDDEERREQLAKIILAIAQGEADLDLVLARAVYQMRPAGSLH